MTTNVTARKHRIAPVSRIILFVVFAALLLAMTAVVHPRPAAAVSSVGGPVTRSEVIARAQAWVRDGVMYSQNQADAAPDGDGHRYRPDCSGMVSMAWHLPKKSDGWDLNTDDFGSWGGKTVLGSYDELLPGDAVLGVGYGHIALFERWDDAAHTRLVVLQENKTGTPANEKVNSRSWYEDNGFKAIRYNNIVPDVPAEDDSVAQGSGDVNNDGRADAVMLYHHSDGAIGLFTSVADSSGGFTPFNVQLTVPGAAVWDWHAFKTLVGDFNGDHRSDVAVMYHHSDGSITMHTSLATASGGFGSFSLPSLTVPAAAVWDWNAIRLTTGDVNNDGRSDAVMLYHHSDGAIGLFTSLADSSGGFAPFNVQLTVPGAAVWDWNAFKTLVADFNGDHRADVAIMYHHSDGSITMHTSLATASGGFGSFSLPSLTVPAAAVWDWNAIRLTTGDVNNDGRSDAVMLYHHGDGAIGLFTSVADSSGGFAPFNVQLTVPAAAVWDWNAFKTITGDYNGDHRNDVAIMYHHSDGSITMHTSLATASGGFGSFSLASLTVPAAAVWDWNAIRLI